MEGWKPILVKRQKLIVVSLFLVLICLMGFPNFAKGEGNEPTVTPTATNTLLPSETPIPSETPQGETEIIQSDASFDQNAAPLPPVDAQAESKSFLSKLQGTNLCLIGVIVVTLIIVMVMVVYGVIQKTQVGG